MKKVIIFISLLVTILFVLMTLFLNNISVDVTDDDLPQDVYTNSGDPFLIAQSVMLEFVNPFSEEDEYTLTEEFMNYMILDSIKENVNAEYDPLNPDCTDSACDVIIDTNYGAIEYAYASLNSENQLVVTINFNRTDYPNVETALYAIFDIEVSIIELQVSLILDSLYVNEMEITTDTLDTILGYFDKDEIEDMVTIGELDLEQYTYSFSLIGE